MNRISKISLLALLLIIAVGFAAVTTNLIINGNAKLSTSLDDFQVMFTSATATNGVANVGNNGTTISFDSNVLVNPGDSSTLTYTVSNNSKEYAANIVLSILGENGSLFNSEYVTITETTTIPSRIEARSSETGVLTITLNKLATTDMQLHFSVQIDATPVEIDTPGSGDITPIRYGPGLYDENGNLLASWNALVNEYGMDYETDYEYDPSEDTLLKTIMSDHEELSSGKKLIFPEGITHIGENSFFDTQLEEVVLPQSLVVIPNHAFAYNYNLSKITFSDNVISIGNGAFSSCPITEFNIPPTLTHLGDMAISGTKIVDIVIPDTVIEFGDTMFECCEELKTAVLPSHLTEIPRSTFFECWALESVVIPDGVTKIGESAFESCESLTYVNIPSGVTEIGEMAFAFSGLESIEIPEGVTTLGAQTLYGTNLTELNIPSGLTTIGGNAIQDIRTLERINVDSNNSNYADIDGVLYTKDLTSLILYPAGNSRTTYTVPTGTTEIGESAFYYSKLTEINLPSGLLEIGSHAFEYCYEITTLTIPSTVTKIGYNIFNGLYQSLKIQSVIFENTEGWKANKTSISSTDLANPTTAKNYLVTTYKNVSWTRS
jgi:hypothetical protein